MKIAFDTNILAYAQGVNAGDRRTAATRAVAAVALEDTIIPVQALGELFNVLVLKAHWDRKEADAAVRRWQQASQPVATSAEIMLQASSLAARHQLRIWDAVVLAAAAEARCNVLLSEDFQDGFVWNGVTVCDPFRGTPHKLIADLLRPEEQ